MNNKWWNIPKTLCSIKQPFITAPLVLLLLESLSEFLQQSSSGCEFRVVIKKLLPFGLGIYLEASPMQQTYCVQEKEKLSFFFFLKVGLPKKMWKIHKKAWKESSTKSIYYMVLHPPPSLSPLPLKCCSPRWRRWGRLWLPARDQTPAASAVGRGGASCRPAPTPQTAEPEPPQGPVQRAQTSPRGIVLADLLGLQEKRGAMKQVIQEIFLLIQRFEANFELLYDLMAGETSVSSRWCCRYICPGHSRGWLAWQMEVWSSGGGFYSAHLNSRAQTHLHHSGR